jgi:hypothetical protein
VPGKYVLADILQRQASLVRLHDAGIAVAVNAEPGHGWLISGSIISSSKQQQQQQQQAAAAAAEYHNAMVGLT